MNFQPKLKSRDEEHGKNICAAMVISLCAAGHLSATENNLIMIINLWEENLNLTQGVGQDIPTGDKVNHKR